MLNSQKIGKTIAIPPSASSATRIQYADPGQAAAAQVHARAPRRNRNWISVSDEDDQEQVDGLGRRVAHLEEPEPVLEDVVDDHPARGVPGAPWTSEAST